MIHPGKPAINVAGCGGAITIGANTYDENWAPHYEGIQFNGAPPPALLTCANAQAQIVYVNGSGGNPFGHALFWIDPSIGFIHSAAPGKNRAYYLPPQNWDDYVAANNKKVWQILPLPGWSGGGAAAARIFQYLTAWFNWHPGHDCVTFCHRVAAAGGVTPANAGSKSVMPRITSWKNARRGLASRIH